MSIGEAQEWDVIVIGAGAAGENAAQYAIQGSERTALIVEAELVGGECSYWACMPSKALLRPVEALRAARAVGGASAAATGELDVGAALARRDSFTHSLDDSSQVEWARGAGIDVLRGRARLSGTLTVELTQDGTRRTLRARQAVVLATGTTASIPPVPGLREALPWTSRDLTNLHEVPERAVVIGGGPVGCESATILRGLGAAEVTLIEPSPSLLSKLEPFAGEAVADALRASGVEVLLATGVQSVERPAAHDRGVGLVRGGPATVGAGGRALHADEIVVAAGRVPATADLGLETVGAETTEAGFLATDDHMAVRGCERWLYAVGDVAGRALLTHMGKYHGRIAGSVIAARAEGRPLDGPRLSNRADDGIVPSVVFTEPQVASVGLTERASRERGIDTECLEYDMGAVAGSSLLRDGYSGRAKLVVDRASDLLVGACFTGPDVAELLHAATTAIAGGVTIEQLWHAVPSYPTVSEVWLRLLESRG